MRGDADFFFSPESMSDALIKSGKVKALAVTTRVSSLPDVASHRGSGPGESPGRNNRFKIGLERVALWVRRPIAGRYQTPAESGNRRASSRS
jgi:hypothetical protein